jgi:hypothetical protein
VSRRPDTYRVAVVVIADVPGVDLRDAGHRLVQLVDAQLEEQMPTPSRGGLWPATVIRAVAGLSVAVQDGLIILQPAVRGGRG